MERQGTRERMLIGAVEVMRERGAAGVTVDAVLERSGSPRGSVYYHFPQGRQQIVAEALDYAGTTINGVIESAVKRGSIAAIDTFVRWWTDLLESSDFAAGCPVAGAAVGAGPADAELGEAAARWFNAWMLGLERVIVNEGVSRARAKRLATLTLAALEGAVMLSKSTRSTTPLKHTATELKALIKSLT